MRSDRVEISSPLHERSSVTSVNGSSRHRETTGGRLCSLNEFSLSGVMRLGCFRFGRFFGGFFFRLEPLGMEDSGLVDALISVRAKKIALRLQEIRWQSGGAITVKIRQRGGKRRDRYAEFDSCRNDQAPFRLRSFDDSCEIPI